MVLSPVYTGDFCRATRCNFYHALSYSKFQTCSKLWRDRGDTIAGDLRLQRQKLHRVGRQIPCVNGALILIAHSPGAQGIE